MSVTKLDALGGAPVPKSPRGGALVRGDLPPAILEFHSPSAALIAQPVRPAARGVTWMVCLLTISCFTAAGLIPVDKVVTAPGRVVSRSPTEVLQPLETSIVRSVDVQEGQVVHKGELMARLDPTFTEADASSLAQQFDSLQAEVDRLTAESQGKQFHPTSGTAAQQTQAAIFAQRAAEYTAKMANYNSKVDELRQQVQGSEADADFYKQRLAVAQNVENMRTELQKDQVGSKLNTLAATDNRMEISRSLIAALNAAEGSRKGLAAQERERDGFDQEWRAQISQDLTDASRKLYDARDQLTKADRRHQLVELRAANDGVVLTVAKISVGSVMQSGDQLITMVPLNAPLEVEANISGDEAGYVHPGDPVSIKFLTFPYVQYGGADGTVRLVSPDAFAADNPTGSIQTHVITPDAPNAQMFYRSRVTLDKVTLHDVPHDFHLVPGMPITADIKVGKRTVLQYLLGRALPVTQDGMREP